MKQTTLAILGISLLVLCGCVAPKSEFAPPSGGLFSNYKAPLLIDYDKASINQRSGDASTEYIHDILLTGLACSWDDCSIDTAARNGRFTRVGAADFEFFTVLGVYAKTTVHVYEAPQPK